MLKFFGRNNIVRDEESFDGSTTYRHLEFYTNNDTKTGHDIERPIENIYENQFQIISFLDHFAKSMTGLDGVLENSLNNEFQITASDITQVTVDGSVENYIRIPPGIAGITWVDTVNQEHVNPYIAVNAPSLKIAERQISKILGMNLPSGVEDIEIKYISTTDSFKARINKKNLNANTYTEYFYGCADLSEFDDVGVTGKLTGVELITDIYNEVDLIDYFRAAISGDLTVIQLEPMFKIDSVDQYYFVIDKEDGMIKVITTVPDATEFQLSAVNVTNVGAGAFTGTIDNSHVLLNEKKVFETTSTDEDSMTLNSAGGIDVNAAGKIDLNSQTTLELNATNNIKVKSQMDIDEYNNMSFLSSGGDINVSTQDVVNNTLRIQRYGEFHTLLNVASELAASGWAGDYVLSADWDGDPGKDDLEREATIGLSIRSVVSGTVAGVDIVEGIQTMDLFNQNYKNGDSVFGIRLLKDVAEDTHKDFQIGFRDQNDAVDAVDVAMNVTPGFDIDFGRNLNPDEDSVFDIGTDTERWKEVFADKINSPTIQGPVTIDGNLTITGTQTTVNTTDLSISDNVILLNEGEAGAGVTAGTSGVEVERGSETNATLIFDESDDEWKAGISGAENAIMLREDTPTNAKGMIWNETNKRLETDPNFDDITHQATLTDQVGVIWDNGSSKIISSSSIVPLGTLPTEFDFDSQGDFDWTTRTLGETLPATIPEAIKTNREDLSAYVELVAIKGSSYEIAAGASLVGVDGMAGVTPTALTSGADSNLQQLLEGLLNPDAAEFTYQELTTVDGHSLTTATWNKVGINETKKNVIAGCSIATSVITLAAGTYDIEASAIGYKTDAHKIRLRDTTNTATLLTGLNANSDSTIDSTSVSVLSGQIILAAGANVELQHYVETTAATGSGVAISDGDEEVYALIKITRRG